MTSVLTNRPEFIAKLMAGDCLEILKGIPDGSVDLILCDPPYGTTACKWDAVIPFDAMWSEIYRVTKENAAICLFGTEPFSTLLRHSNLDNFKYDWIWYKNAPTGFMLANKQPMRCYEIISVFSKGKVPYYKQLVPSRDRTAGKRKEAHRSADSRIVSEHIEIKRDSSIKGGSERKTLVNPRNVLEFDVINSNDPQKTKHPTQKPVQLLEYLIKTYSEPGDTVLDFTMGSGSTGVAAKNTERHFIGIEKDAGYFEIAKLRIDCA